MIAGNPVPSRSLVRPAAPSRENLIAQSGSAMASTSHPVATEVALEIMRAGGTAADAYVAAAFAQTVLEPDMTTLAGTFVINHWSATQRALAFAGGTFGVPAALRDDGSHEVTSDGRAVLVPGFVRGAFEAHRRWGKLDWKSLIQPAIEIAHEGFEIDWSLWGHFYQYQQWIGRCDRGRATWFRDGRPLMIGERLRQPQLAATLEGLRDDGPDYMYRGPWGREFIDTVNSHNGVLAPQDLEGSVGVFSSADWHCGQSGQPATTTFHGLELAPTAGLMAMALNLVEAADLAGRGAPLQSADTLYLLMRIAQQVWHSARLYNAGTHDMFVSKDYARSLLPLIERGPPLDPIGFRIGTCAIAITDPFGNIATGTHSVSSSPFGVGYTVGGVILNRGIHIMRLRQAIAGLNSSVILFKDGNPVLTAASPSRSFFENLLQQLCFLLEYGMSLEQAVQQPRFGGVDEHLQIARIECGFPRDVLSAVAKRGMKLFEVAPLDYQCGSLHAIRRNSDGSLTGCADPRRRGSAKGF